jgi:hypothetical protein
MSKPVNDVRASSYDERTANPIGYQGTIADALEQIKCELNLPNESGTAREQLLEFLRVSPQVSVLDTIFGYKAKLADLETQVDRISLDAWIEAHAVQS